MELILGGAAHLTFVDLHLMINSFGIREKFEEVKHLLGTVDGSRGLGVAMEYLSAFVEFVLKGKDENLVGSHGDDGFPEVVVKRRV